MGERLEMEITAKNSTGKGWSDVEREAKERANRFRSLSGEGFEFGGGDASKSLRGLSHISRGFKEMLEGDVLQGGATIARGLQHSFGQAFSAISLSAVAALGTAFAGFKIGEWIDSKLGISDKIANMIVPPEDLSGWRRLAAAIKEAHAAMEEYIKTIEKRIKASQEFGGRELTNIKNEEAHLQKMIALEERLAELKGDQSAPRREALRKYAAGMDATDKEETELKRQKSLYEGTATKLSKEAERDRANYESYSGSVNLGPGQDANLLRVKELRNKSNNSTYAYQDFMTKNSKGMQDTQDRLNQISGHRQEMKAELEVETAGLNQKSKEEREKKAEKLEAIKEAGLQELIEFRKSELESEKKNLQTKEESARKLQDVTMDEINAKRAALERILAPSKDIPDVMSRIMGLPNRSLAEKAAHDVQMGMNPRALRDQADQDQREHHERERFKRKSKQAMDNAKRRHLTKGEASLLRGIAEETELRKAVEGLAKLDIQEKAAKEKERANLDAIRKATEATQAKIETLMVLKGGQ